MRGSFQIAETGIAAVVHILYAPSGTRASVPAFHVAAEHDDLQPDLLSLPIDLAPVVGPLSLDALEKPIDVHATLELVLPDGRSASTSLPPVELIQHNITSWLWRNRGNRVLFGVEPVDPNLDDSLLVVDESGSFRWNVVGRRGTLAEVDYIAADEAVAGIKRECTAELDGARGTFKATVTVQMNATKVSIFERRTGREVASTTLPPPTTCAWDVIGLVEGDRDGEAPFTAHSARPTKQIEAWVTAWFARRPEQP